ncbi:endonuclease/exonuclease/phosphatase family protein, partial [Trifolium medium]|nr:endonuclease/exonuclease/phosphatase family protein [Trifolium medium]
QVDGWGGYVLKENLKMIKGALKECHATHAQNLPSRIDSLKVQFSALDQKGEDEVLSEAELAEFHGVTSDIHSLSQMNANISGQSPPKECYFCYSGGWAYSGGRDSYSAGRGYAFRVSFQGY